MRNSFILYAIMNGSILKQMRMAHGLSQIRLAALCSVSLRTLQYWEKGYYSISTLKEMSILTIFKALEENQNDT